MIGRRIECTLWHVHYKHRNVDPPLIQLSGRDKPPEHIEGQVNLLTADPTGSDLCEVAAMIVLGSKRTPKHEFGITHAQRLDDLRGLAMLAGEES